MATKFKPRKQKFGVILSPYRIRDLQKLLEYASEDEEKNYEENPCSGHIVHIIRRLQKVVP